MSNKWQMLMLVVLGLCVASHVEGQQAGRPSDSKFEVNTVRISPKDATGSDFNFGLKRFATTNTTLRSLIEFAYRLHSEQQLEGLPAWAQEERFDVVGSMTDEEAAILRHLPLQESEDRQRLDLQSLLAERFGLECHTTMKRLPAFALVREGRVPKLVEVPASRLPHDSDPEGFKAAQASGILFPTLHGGGGHVEATAVSMNMFASWLNHQADYARRLVVDETGLKGNYSFAFDYQENPNVDKVADGQSEPPLGTAIHEALGIRVKPADADIAVLVVTHIAQPDPN